MKNMKRSEIFFTIAKYIGEQESHDIAMDKVTEKEYEDPFKGGK